MKPKSLFTAILLIGTLMFSAKAFADPIASILYQETNLGGGSYRYDYTFYNDSTADESLYKVIFYFDQSTTTGLPLPTGWVGTVWNGTATNTFLNTIALNQNYYIAPDEFLGGFSFIINRQLGNSSFSAEFKDNEGSYYAFSGNTAAAPPVVPEPVSSTLFIIGGIALGVRKYLGRKK